MNKGFNYQKYFENKGENKNAEFDNYAFSFDPDNTSTIVYKVEDISDNKLRLHFFYDGVTALWEGDSHYRIPVRYIGTIVCAGSIKRSVKQSKGEKTVFKIRKDLWSKAKIINIENSELGKVAIKCEKLLAENLDMYTFDKDNQLKKYINNSDSDMGNNDSLTTENCSDVVSKSGAEIPLILGKDKSDTIIVKDLSKVKSLIIAGGTGSGKTNFIRTILYEIGSTMHPKDIEIVCMEMKMIGEYNLFNKSKFLLRKVITDIPEGIGALQWCVKEMESRYEQKTKKPYILILIDEVSDLMLNDERTEKLLLDLIKRGSDVGIITVISTSIPSTRVLTDNVLNEVEARAIFSITRDTDSVRLLGISGAEKLKGNGDMLFKEARESEVVNLQSPFTSEELFESLAQRIHHF